MTKDLDFMYNLYPSYGGMLSKIYWCLFRNCSIVRSLDSIDSNNVSFPYDKIVELEGNSSLMAFNLGTPGKDQKISILGYNQESKESFFAKFSDTKNAIALTQNEIRVYQILDSTNLTPKLLDSKEEEDLVWMKTSCIKGRHMSSMKLTKEIVDIAINLSAYHLKSEITSKSKLRTSLSHGDFCPWNMLVDEGKIQLIDWEMADERPLGYDIFKYIWQISLLFTPEKTINDVVEENKNMIEYYFKCVNVDNWSEYLSYFVEINTMRNVLMPTNE